MKFSQFSEILSKLSLVTRLKFRSADGWTIFSVIRSFEGWIIIDQTGCINFRFTRFVPSVNRKEEAIDLFFSDGKQIRVSKETYDKLAAKLEVETL